MQLTQFTDYSLRTLIALGINNGRLMTIQEIADYYGISKAHLMKVVHNLSLCGYIETVRGRVGGMRLARPPELISVGEVVRDTEVNMNIAECFGENFSCALLPSCVLRTALSEARKSFLNTLDGYQLSDLLVNRRRSPDLAVVQLSKKIAARLDRSVKKAGARVPAIQRTPK